MIDFEQKISKLEIELSALKEKVYFLSVVYDKFDTTLEKIESVIEARREGASFEVKELRREMEQLEKKILEAVEDCREELKDLHHANTRKIEEQSGKIEDLNKWRWITVGAAGIIAWIISKVSNMVNISP
jgi:predicted RNase H-like nuclease (RuvC/YqgF family)